MNPYDILTRRSDQSRPFMTYYAGPDQRVELSVASTANAVAKAAGMLGDELGLGPGAKVSIDLPLHWQLGVWTLASLTVGAEILRHDSELVAVRIVGPADLPRLAGGANPVADEVLISSCDAFGLPVSGAMPHWVRDIGVEVRAQPDRYQPAVGAEFSARIRTVASASTRWGDLLELNSPEAPQRLWVDETTPDLDLPFAVGVQPLLSGGSVVLATGLSVAQGDLIRRAEGLLR